MGGHGEKFEAVRYEGCHFWRKRDDGTDEFARRILPRDGFLATFYCGRRSFFQTFAQMNGAKVLPVFEAGSR